ncbi:MAG TPA: hypothetical protein VF281_03270 [Candidatus Saccharimonadales bacterium]
MTQSSNSITPEDVVEALGQSERFPEGSEQFEIFSPFVGQLVEIIGEDRFDAKVGIGGLCDVTGRFVRSLAKDSTFVDGLGDIEKMLVPSLYIDLADQLEGLAQNPDAALSEMGISESEAMEMEQLGLNDTAKLLYRQGELTYAKLLEVGPDVFIPRS